MVLGLGKSQGVSFFKMKGFLRFQRILPKKLKPILGGFFYPDFINTSMMISDLVRPKASGRIIIVIHHLYMMFWIVIIRNLIFQFFLS